MENPAIRRRSEPAVAAQQAGVFTRGQARAEGWSGGQIQRRLRRGVWQRVAGQGLSAGNIHVTALMMAWAAHLTWPGCIVSHYTAAAIYGWPGIESARAHVVSAVRRSAVRGVVVHRGQVDRDAIRLIGNGLTLTTPLRTAVDCLALLPFEEGLRLWAYVSTRSIVTREELAAAARARLGLKGTPALLLLMRATSTGAVSVAEMHVHRILARAGITGWVANATVCDAAGLVGAVDILFPAQRVIIEVDGWQSHRMRRAFVDDRRRQNRLAAAGYTVLRVTWDDLTPEGRGHLIVHLRAVLALRTSGGTPDRTQW